MLMRRTEGAPRLGCEEGEFFDRTCETVRRCVGSRRILLN